MSAAMTTRRSTAGRRGSPAGRRDARRTTAAVSRPVRPPPNPATSTSTSTTTPRSAPPSTRSAWRGASPKRRHDASEDCPSRAICREKEKAMTLDPQARYVLDLIAQAGRPAYPTMTAAEARRVYRETRGPLQVSPPEIAAVTDRSIAGPGGRLALRLYRPFASRAGEALPALVYFHGGGWTIGDLDTHDTVCRSLANQARCAVVSVDYRLGPEHKFPAAVDDSVAATRWVAAEATDLALDPDRLAVGGDSAGGNLAA